jgi:hypothetical protein
MASDSNTARSGGIGFSGLLAVLFIGLKLGGVIDWSWWWVLSPLWISAALGLLILVVAGVFVLARPRKRTTRRY